MNIFSAIHVYPGAWQETDSRSFTEEELASIKSAKVVDSDYGSSVCFYMKSGGTAYIPLSNKCSKAVGEEVDVKSAKLITLSREGDADIYRVDC